MAPISRDADMAPTEDDIGPADAVSKRIAS